MVAATLPKRRHRPITAGCASPGRVMRLSEQFKFAFKVSLSLVIVYGVALSQGWGKPGWAAFTVLVASLATAGESINKGLLRLLGTLVAAVVTIVLLGLFPQDRWAFVFSVGAYCAFCTFMMVGNPRYYFWLVAGMLVPMFSLAGGSVPLNSFAIMVLRLQETLLGLLTFSLVWLTFWPTSSRQTFDDTLRGLVEDLNALLGQHLSTGPEDADDMETNRLRTRTAQAQARLRDLLEGAQVEDYRIWESRAAWRAAVNHLSLLADEIERWRSGIGDVRHLDTLKVLPSLAADGEEIRARLSAIVRMLAGEAPAHEPAPVALPVQQAALDALPLFDRTALLLFRHRLIEVARLAQEVFDAVAGIEGSGRAVGASAPRPASQLAAALDPDRLAVVARQAASYLLAVLAYIYVPDMPQPTIAIVFVVSIGMNLSRTPQVPIAILLPPMAFGIALGCFVYVFVMPLLSGFAELAAVITACVFIISYLFSRPEQMLARSVSLMMLLMIANIQNGQTYDVLWVTNLAASFLLMLCLVALTTWFPISFRPEQVYLRLVARYFRACVYLTEALQHDPRQPMGILEQVRRARHLHALAVVPTRLGMWGHSLPLAARGRATAEQIEAFAASLPVMTYRIRDVIQARAAPQSEALARALAGDARAWRIGLQEIFGSLATDAAAADHAQLRERLDALLAHFQRRVEATLTEEGRATAQTDEGENSLRLLGALRGLSEALVELARRTAEIDWPMLRESRF